MGDSNFYGGTNYGLDAKYGSSESDKAKTMNPFASYPVRTPAGSLTLATDARTANQLKATTEKFNTGAKTIEVQMIAPDVTESIPNQHLDEIRRLKKLVGGDLTLHGPLVEATGITKQGWDVTDRMQAERQMWSALERGHRLSPKGNIVVTFHSSNGLPEPMVKEFVTMPNGERKEKVTSFMAVDESRGQFVPVSPERNELTGEGDPESLLDPKKVKALLENQSKETWTRELTQLSFHAHSGEETIKRVLSEKIMEDGEIKELLTKEGAKGILDFYKNFNTPEGQKLFNNLSDRGKAISKKMVYDLNHGDVYIRDSYTNLQKMFTQAWNSARINDDKETEAKLREYRDALQKNMESFKDPRNMQEFAEQVQAGVSLLNSIRAPNTLKPLKEFAIEQAGETFSNLAIKAYNSWGESDSVPIISIENPPAGSGLSRAEDLKDLLEESRKKFREKAVLPKSQGGAGLSEKEAKEQADKLLGVTWDVGHINMIKKYGYTDEDLKKQTQTIAPYIKHIHLSDNFGMEHTELPMGMGNVPLPMHMQVLQEQFGDKLNDIKKVIETGNWYQHFQTTPFVETLQAFGSPIYGMKMQPYWNQAAGQSAGYFAGHGMNPDVHHSIYGAGFSSLPTELGGQMQGGRSRFSGTPSE